MNFTANCIWRGAPAGNLNRYWGARTYRECFQEEVTNGTFNTSEGVPDKFPDTH